jgi:hypothetical protein
MQEKSATIATMSASNSSPQPIRRNQNMNQAEISFDHSFSAEGTPPQELSKMRAKFNKIESTATFKMAENEILCSDNSNSSKIQHEEAGDDYK